MPGHRTDPNTVAALKELARRKGGLLHPGDVVDAARSESSPLHRYFEWDDTKAAEAWRVQQARVLLNTVFVKILRPDGKPETVEMFVSLKSDREDGGYRTMVDVLSDKDRRQELISDCLDDMQTFQQRYKIIRELVGVFASMRRASIKLAT